MSKIITSRKCFLLWYAHDHLSFRLQEFLAITKIFGIEFEWCEEPSKKDPFYIIYFSSSVDVMKLMSRTVLIKSAYELWSNNTSLSGLHTNLKQLPKSLIEPYCKQNVTFRIMVESFGKKLSQEKKIERIDELTFLNFKGQINLKNPDHSFLLMEYYSTDRNNVPEFAYRYFFGRWIADGQRWISQKINLKDRKFIGNTSMDPLLSLVMANIACIKSGDLVLDPFVGSGGLLVAAAHFGGYVLGTDIDYLMLHGKAKPSRPHLKYRDPDESTYTNMKQYGYECQYLDVIISDASLPLWRCSSLFDVIITDPPYGIRESTERIGSEKYFKIPDHLASDHIPQKISYTLQSIIEDLLDFSSAALKINGRLIYWMPSFNEDFDEKKLPHHPCLKLIGYCKQSLTGHSSRYLITMEKIKEKINHLEKGFVPDSTLNFRKKYFGPHRKKDF